MTTERLELTTREGWASFVAAGPAIPVEPLSSDEAASATRAQVAEHTRQRIAYHSSLWVIETSPMRTMLQSATDLVTMNSVSHGSPRGLIISGEPGVGKTTALTSVGMKLHLSLERNADRSVPVIYIILPSHCTAKEFCQQVMHFLALPYKESDKPGKLLRSIQTTTKGAGTAVVLVDEIHSLSWGEKMAQRSADYLKYFTDTTGLTIIAAGVQATNTVMITQGRGNQIAGRYEVISIEPFAHTTQRQRQTWRSFVESFESLLRLRDHPAGSLQEMSEYLHARTHGYVGSLAHLVQRAAMRAITSGSERIDRKLLDGVPMDHAAEQRSAAEARSRRRK